MKDLITGPKIIEVETCKECMKCTSARVTILDFSGHDVFCRHSKFFAKGLGEKKIGWFIDGQIWQTPEWCPVKL
jgi:hypothetical protein